MLIKIDDTLTEYIIENYDELNSDSTEIIALNNIAKAFQEGYHVVSASLEALEVLIGLEYLEHRSKHIYHYLFSKFSFLPSYEEFCCSYILIKSNDFSFSKIKEENKVIYEIPINYFSEFLKLWPTVLLSEDLSDCDFYEKLAQKYIDENKGKLNLSLNFNSISGGGVRSYKMYDRLINEGRMVLAIADNDQSYPHDKIGQTLVQLKNTHSTYEKHSVIDLYELRVREKENLVSPSMYLMCSNNSSKNILQLLKKIEDSSEHQSKLKYIDIKDGIKAKRIKDPQYVDYLREIFESVNLISCSLEEANTQHDDTMLMMGIGSKLDDFMDEILGDGLEIKLETKKIALEKFPIPEVVIKEMEGNVLKKQFLFNNLPDYLKDEWFTLSKKIISWGCCQHPVA